MTHVDIIDDNNNKYTINIMDGNQVLDTVCVYAPNPTVARHRAVDKWRKSQ